MDLDGIREKNDKSFQNALAPHLKSDTLRRIMRFTLVLIFAVSSLDRGSRWACVGTIWCGTRNVSRRPPCKVAATPSQTPSSAPAPAIERVEEPETKKQPYTLSDASSGSRRAACTGSTAAGIRSRKASIRADKVFVVDPRSGLARAGAIFRLSIRANFSKC